MASFLKKIFSFGRQEEPKPAETVESKVASDEVVTPSDAPALPDFLRRTDDDAPLPPEPQPTPEVPFETPDRAPEPKPETPLPVEPEQVPAVPPSAIEVPPVVEPAAPVRDEPAPAVPDFLRQEPEETAAPEPARIRVAKTVERDIAPAAAPVAASRPWFERLREGLSRSSRELGDNISGLFTKGRLTDEIVDELEEVLIRADLGMDVAVRVTDTLASGRYGRQSTEADVRSVMAAEIEKVLAPVALPLELDLSVKPHVVLVVGVNGTGKTTTIGKLAAKLTAGGLKVTLAAGDTFRAAAIEQLKIWGERTGSQVVASKLGADAAGLAFEAYQKAKEAGSDVVIIDTAGRLQNKAELMAELEKIVRVLKKHDDAAPHTVLQTVDATTGQNAMNQVEIFRNVAGVNGLVMTKLDGTARGGILVAIAAKHGLPVYFIGVGEGVDDLEPFDAGDFARAIAGA